MNVLEAIEKGAGIASLFVPNPAIAAGLKFISSFADKAHQESAANGTVVPTLDAQSFASIVPKEILNDLLDGKTITIEINGKGIQQAIEDLSRATQAMQTIQSAFKIK